MIRLKHGIGICLLSTLILGQPALAGHERYDKARVVDVQPIHDIVRIPVSRRECWTEEVETRRAAGNGTRTVIGAIVGGVVGHQLAKGDDRFKRRAATAAGAVVGGALGHDLERRGESGWHEQRRCRVTDAYREEERLAGYRVRYRYHGRTYTTEMDHDPGPFLRVRVDVRPAE